VERAQVEALPTGEFAVMDWGASPAEEPCQAVVDSQEAATTICDLLNRGEWDKALHLAGEESAEDAIRNG
jgi:hypothetical protein